ncbi:ZNF8 protein, partial [Passerina amoena]|nr:ZNF8 protein [Passerina amoena]
GTEGPLSHIDPNSKLPHMKEESHGGAPCAGGRSGNSDSSDSSDSCAWSGSDTKDDPGGRWQSGSGVPRSGCRDTERGGRARAPPRPVPAASGLLTGRSGGAEAPPGRPYLCGTCGKSFRHRRSLLAHKKLRRGNRARHGCAECGRSFCLHGDLLRHRHSHRARPQSCAGAGAGAAGPAGERPFVCGPCGRSFSWRESLELHLRQHRAHP